MLVGIAAGACDGSKMLPTNILLRRSTSGNGNAYDQLVSRTENKMRMCHQDVVDCSHYRAQLEQATNDLHRNGVHVCGLDGMLGEKKVEVEKNLHLAHNQLHYAVADHDNEADYSFPGIQSGVSGLSLRTRIEMEHRTAKSSEEVEHLINHCQSVISQHTQHSRRRRQRESFLRL